MLLILCTFLRVPEWEDGRNSGLHVVELFAGVARISRLAARLGLRTRAYDICYTPVRNPYRRKRGKLPRSPMDLNGCAGLVFLCLCTTQCFPICFWQSVLHPRQTAFQFSTN